MCTWFGIRPCGLELGRQFLADPQRKLDTRCATLGFKRETVVHRFEAAAPIARPLRPEKSPGSTAILWELNCLDRSSLAADRRWLLQRLIKLRQKMPVAIQDATTPRY